MHLADPKRLGESLGKQKQVLLALEGWPPAVGPEVLWVLRDCWSGEVLLAGSLLGASEEDLGPLRSEVASAGQVLEVPLRGLICAGEQAIRKAVAHALPGVPHHLCHFHSLRAAAQPIYEAERQAKKERKKHVRGVRPLEGEWEGGGAEEAAALGGYGLAVGSALSDDGQPPLQAAGLKLLDRGQAIDASSGRVEEKRGLPPNLRACSAGCGPGS